MAGLFLLVKLKHVRDRHLMTRQQVWRKSKSLNRRQISHYSEIVVSCQHWLSGRIVQRINLRDKRIAFVASALLNVIRGPFTDSAQKVPIKMFRPSKKYPSRDTLSL
jgi:hypothetical protein